MLLSCIRSDQWKIYLPARKPQSQRTTASGYQRGSIYGTYAEGHSQGYHQVHRQGRRHTLASVAPVSGLYDYSRRPSQVWHFLTCPSLRVTKRSLTVRLHSWPVRRIGLIMHYTESCGTSLTNWVFSSYYFLQMKSAKVIFSQVFVHGGGVSVSVRGVSIQRGSLSRVVLCLGGLCPG